MTKRGLLVPIALLLAGCFQQDKANISRVLPLDYPNGFERVRDCRPNAGHDSVYASIQANQVAQDAYLQGLFPLPAGSVLVSAETGAWDCSYATGFTVMFKESPGYNAAAGDWRWQRLDADHTVLEDGRVQKCISCHTSACSAHDFTCASSSQ